MGFVSAIAIKNELEMMGLRYTTDVCPICDYNYSTNYHFIFFFFCIASCFSSCLVSATFDSYLYKTVHHPASLTASSLLWTWCFSVFNILTHYCQPSTISISKQQVYCVKRRFMGIITEEVVWRVKERLRPGCNTYNCWRLIGFVYLSRRIAHYLIILIFVTCSVGTYLMTL